MANMKDFVQALDDYRQAKKDYENFPLFGGMPNVQLRQYVESREQELNGVFRQVVVDFIEYREWDKELSR